MKFQDLRISGKLGFGFGLVIAIVIVVGTVSVQRLMDVADLTGKIYDHPLKVGYSVRDIKASINAMHRSMKDVAIGESVEEIKFAVSVVDELERNVYSAFNIVFERFLGDMTDVQKAYDSFKRWKKIRDEVVTLSLAKRQKEAAAITKGKGARHVIVMNRNIQKMIDFANYKAETFYQGALDKRAEMVKVLVLFITFMIILGVTISFLISRSIVNPLKLVLSYIRNISSGNLSDEVEISTKDEVGHLAESCRELQRDLRYRVGQARKIIDGDFSHDIPPRSENDDLGETFFRMSQSIRRVTDELSMSEQKLRTIMDSAPAGIIVTDEEGRITDFNRTTQSIFGYQSKSELEGLSLAELFLQEDEFYEMELFLNKDAGIQGQEVEFRRADESSFWGSLSTVRKALSSGEINFIATIVDLTARKIAEDRISESEARYRSVFNTAGSVIVCLNTDFEIIEWNYAAESIFGYNREEVIGKNYLSLVVDPDYALMVKKDFQKVLNGLATENFEYRVITSEGEGKYLLWNVTGLSDSGNNRSGLITIGQDLTDRKKAEKDKALLKMELIQAQKMESLGTLAGGIAHDFNNILSVIMGYTEISMGQVVSSEVNDNLNQVLKASVRARELVHQILAFSRKTETARSFVKVERIVKEAVRFLRASLPTSIRMEFLYEGSPAPVYVNATQINQIVMNLCSNAAHAIGNKPGTIELRLRDVRVDESWDIRENIEPGDYQQLSIKDSGDGMSEELTGRIFEPYFTTKASGEGSGMGLAVVYGIVKSYGGFINVSSREGEGTVFDVFIPVSEEINSSSAKKDDRLEALRGNESIMFVDDEKALVDLWDMVLRSAGYTVDSFNESPAALEMYTQSPDRYDLIVADINMPNMTGLNLLKAVREIRQDMPVILCTGYTGIAKEEVLNASGVNSLLIKPVARNVMLKAIRGVLDNK